jgi:hypothetical protein
MRSLTRSGGVARFGSACCGAVRCCTFVLYQGRSASGPRRLTPLPGQRTWPHRLRPSVRAGVASFARAWGHAWVTAAAWVSAPTTLEPTSTSRSGIRSAATPPMSTNSTVISDRAPTTRPQVAHRAGQIEHGEGQGHGSNTIAQHVHQPTSSQISERATPQRSQHQSSIQIRAMTNVQFEDAPFGPTMPSAEASDPARSNARRLTRA